MDDSQLSERIFYDYLKRAYDVFIETGNEEDPIMDKELIKNFDSKNEMIIKQIEDLKLETEGLEKELQVLTGQDSPLIQIQNELKRLESEREQFKDSYNQMESDQLKLHDSILALGADLDLMGNFITILSLRVH